MSTSILYPFVKYTFDDGKAIYSDDLDGARSLVGAGNKVLILIGASSPGDGGGGVFYWNPAYHGVDDGGATAFYPYAVGVGAWVRLPGIGTGGGGTGTQLLVDPGVTATGTNYSTGYPITKYATIFDLVPAGTGGSLPLWAVNSVFLIRHRDLTSGSNLLIYPDPASQIITAGVGAPIAVAPGTDTVITNDVMNTWMPS